MTTTDRDRAVVLGSGIAGLLTARALADTFDEVVLVDRDHLDTGTEPRRGTPQARHLHGLLPGGQRVIEGFFPGLTAELVRAGAKTGDVLGNALLCFGGHRFRQGTAGLEIIGVTRPTLEAAIRNRVLAIPNVHALGGHDVVGLAAAPNQHDVVGARVIGRADGSAEEHVSADLVVDATGRGSRLPRWLESLGLAAPRVERVDVGVGYATRRYRLPAGAMGSDVAVISAPAPSAPRGGAIALVEGGGCLVTLMGMLGDHPPTDPAGFERFAADLALPDVRELLDAGEPLDDPVGYRYPSSLRVRYDRMRPWPAGLVVLGDAVCTLNPIYGQGMSVAALEVAALHRRLARPGAFRPDRFQREVGKVSGLAWAMALGADLAHPGVEGPRTSATRALGRYVERVQSGATHDPELGAAFLRVTSMVDSPAALLRPAVLGRSLMHRPARSPSRASLSSAAG